MCEINPYDHFKVEPRANEVEVVVGEPDMLNPNSFENLSSILQTLGRRGNIDRYATNDDVEKRKWIFIENDGGILNPCLLYTSPSPRDS